MVDHDNHDDVPPTNPNDWSMVVIHDDKDTFLFPPINHENLQIPQHSSSSSPSSFSSSDSDTWTPSSSSSFDSQISKNEDFIGWISIGVQILRSKLLAVFSSFQNRATDGGTIWSFWVPAAALLMSCWVVVKKWKWRKTRTLTPNEARLINIIKEKDGKIAQLLHQIAQMNELLIDRHKALAAKVVE